MSRRFRLSLSYLPLGVKFALAPILAVCLLGLVAMLGYSGLSRSAQEMRLVVDGNLQGGITLASIAGRMHQTVGTLYQVMTSHAAGLGDAQATRRISALGGDIDAIIADIARYRRSHAATAEQPMLDQALQELRTYKDAVDFVAGMLEIDFKSAAAFVVPFEANYNRLTGLIDAMIQATVADSVRRAEHTTASAERMREYFLFFTLLAAVLVVLVTFHVGRRTTRSITAIADATLMLARGEHEVDIARLRTGDELAAIVDSLAVFRRNQLELKETWSREERQKGELDALAQQQERLRQILDTAPVGAAITTGKTVRFTNRRAEELIGIQAGQELPDLYVDPAQRRAALQAVVAEGVVRDLEVQVFGANHQILDVLITLMTIDYNGETGILGWIWDVTLLKQVENDLRHAKNLAESANVAKSAFLANMSHELRTPLNAVIGYAEMLEEELADLQEETLSADARKIRAAGKHLLELINDILDLSKIEAGKMDLLIETIELGSLIEDVCTTIRPLIEKNGNTLVVDCPPGLPPLEADLVKVRQSLLNLLSNASKFTRGGRIVLQVAPQDNRDGRWLTFAVSDTGIGMTEEQIGRLFQPFSQADASTTRQFGGTGLGLAITRRFCRMMGGEVMVTSEIGLGTTFTIFLPVERGSVEAAGPIDGPGLIDHPGRGRPGPPGRLILVIDDDPVAQELLRRALLEHGFRVICADQGQQGLALARQHQPDLITLDVIMPRADGWSVLIALKGDPELAAIPVMIVSMVEEEQLSYALGAAHYLTKPIDYDKLQQILRHYRSNPTVLLVDDDPATRGMMRRALEKAGWGVAEAENGQVALEALEAQPAGVVLLDLMMPVMNGFDVIAELRNRPHLQQIPVIVLTAKDITADDRLRLDGSVKRILQKGKVSIDELVGEISRMASVASASAVTTVTVSGATTANTTAT